MAIITLQNITQTLWDGEVWIPTDVFRMDALTGKTDLKISVKPHPQDKSAVDLYLTIRLVHWRSATGDSVLEPGYWRESANMTWESYGPGGHTNKWGVSNPNPFIRFDSGNLNDIDLRCEIMSNGVRAAIVIGGMDKVDRAADDDQGEN